MNFALGLVCTIKILVLVLASWSRIFYKTMTELQEQDKFCSSLVLTVEKNKIVKESLTVNSNKDESQLKYTHCIHTADVCDN